MLRGLLPGGEREWRRLLLDVEPHVEDVPVLDDVGLALQPLLAGSRGLCVRAGGDEVVPADDLAPDEAARDVGVNRRRGVERGETTAQSPRAGLLLARGEERDEVERFRELAHDLAERRLAGAAKLGRLFRRQLDELGLELQVDSAGAVLDRDQRLRRQRFELAGPIRNRLARVESREQRLEIRGFLLQLQLSGLR